MSARTIQECVGPEAIARRERRRKKILEQNEKDSTLGSCIPFNSFDFTLGYHTLSDSSTSSPKSHCYVVNELSDARNSSMLCNAGDTYFSDTFLGFSVNNTQPVEVEEDPITYTMPEYADTVDRQRLVDALTLGRIYICFSVMSLGAILGICSMYTNGVAGISLVLLLLISGYEISAFKSVSVRNAQQQCS